MGLDLGQSRHDQGITDGNAEEKNDPANDLRRGPSNSPQRSFVLNDSVTRPYD